jgi:hypothetical protein
MEQRRLALPWFRSGDYEDIRRIMSDGHSMSASYATWLKVAEADALKAELHGMLVERVMIEPFEFEVWCAANEMPTDGYARELFAAENASVENTTRAYR